MVLLGVLVVVLDWTEVRKISGQASWKPVLWSFLFCALSYFCLSYSFAVVNRLFDIKRGLRFLLNVGYVSAALNNLLAFAGAAGISLRLILMQQPSSSSGQVLAASIFHSYLNNLVMVLLLPMSLIYLLASHSVNGAATVGVALATGFLILFLFIATVILFSPSTRAVVLKIFSRIWHFIVRKDISPFLGNLDTSLTLGVTAMRERPLTLTLSVGLIVADWILAMVVLWFCFDALGNPINPGVLLVGFAIGISAGNISLIPGGLGVQEASMAGVYALLGVPFAQAGLAVILFRIIYDFIPFLVSLLFYRQILRHSNQAGQSDGEYKPNS
jgi:uncharacterized protein (TIRG00374 family)